MFDFADVYVWFLHNKWWMWGVLPFIVLVIIVRSIQGR